MKKLICFMASMLMAGLSMASSLDSEPMVITVTTNAASKMRTNSIDSVYGKLYAIAIDRLPNATMTGTVNVIVSQDGISSTVYANPEQNSDGVYMIRFNPTLGGGTSQVSSTVGTMLPLVNATISAVVSNGGLNVTSDVYKVTIIWEK